MLPRLSAKQCLSRDPESGTQKQGQELERRPADEGDKSGHSPHPPATPFLDTDLSLHTVGLYQSSHGELPRPENTMAELGYGCQSADGGWGGG